MKKKIFNFQDFQATAMTKTISSGSQKVEEEAYPQIFLEKIETFAGCRRRRRRRRRCRRHVEKRKLVLQQT